MATLPLRHHLDRALQLAHSQKIEDARAELHQAFVDYGQSIEILASAGKIELNEGYIEESEYFVKSAILCSPINYDALMNYAIYLEKTQHILLAYDIYIIVSSLYKSDYLALDRMAWISLILGRSMACLEHIEMAFSRGMPLRHHLISWAVAAGRKQDQYDRLLSLLGQWANDTVAKSLSEGVQRAQVESKLASEIWTSTMDQRLPTLDDVAKAMASGDMEFAVHLLKCLIYSEATSKEDLLRARELAFSLPDGAGLAIVIAQEAFRRFPQDQKVIYNFAQLLIMRDALADGANLLMTIVNESDTPVSLIRLLIFCAAGGSLEKSKLIQLVFSISEKTTDKSIIDYALSFILKSDIEGKNLQIGSSNSLMPDFALKRGATHRWFPSTFRIATPKIRPRLAICISGQLRSYRQTWPRTRAALESFETRIFVSTWARTGSGIGAHDTVERMLPPELKARIQPSLMRKSFFSAELPHCLTLMEADSFVDRADIQGFFDTEHVEIGDEAEFEEKHASAKGLLHLGTLNQAKMFYGISRANEMRLAGSDSNGFNCDAVMRIRPDKAVVRIGYGDVDNAMKNPIVLTDYRITGGIGDQILLSNSTIANIYSDIWPRMNSTRGVNFFPGSSGRFNEFLLAEWMIYNGTSHSVFNGSKFDTASSISVDLVLLWKAACLDLVHDQASAGQRAFARAIWACLKGISPAVDFNEMASSMNRSIMSNIDEV